MTFTSPLKSAKFQGLMFFLTTLLQKFSRSILVDFGKKMCNFVYFPLKSATWRIMSIYKMKGVGEELEVFEDKLSITPKGVLGFVSKGLKGTKTIPYASITAIQFKKSGLVTSGYIQFTIPGGNESKGGVFAATTDENTFMFAGQNELAIEIKNYIEDKIKNIHLPSPAPIVNSSSDEIAKYFDLKEKGIISEEEFEKKKKQLLGI